MINLQKCQWPEGEFKYFEPNPEDDHGKVYLVAPGGQMYEVTGHADPEVDPARAKWMAKHLNEAKAGYYEVLEQSFVDLFRFIECEMGWEHFRATFLYNDPPEAKNKSLENAKLIGGYIKKMMAEHPRLDELIRSTEQ